MSHEGDGYAEVYRATTRTAAKERRCTACGGRIRVGDRYVDVFVLCEGDAYQFRRCSRCEAIHAHLRARCAQGADGRFPADDLDCGEEYLENWGEEPPPEISALAFALPGEVTLEKKP